MKRNIWLLVFIALVLVSMTCPAQAARAIPASNETSTLIVEISAYADGGLRARTDMALCQGNEDLRDICCWRRSPQFSQASHNCCWRWCQSCDRSDQIYSTNLDLSVYNFSSNQEN